MRWICILLVALCAHTAYASVVITEIAWMGDTQSADNEWIELYNTSSETITLDGWYLEVIKHGTNELSFSITLQGELPPSAYGVLERTDENSAEGQSLLIYKGALANTGADLSLYNANGQLIDRVGGGENWEQIHGDNITKDTAQKSAQGWLSARPTPGGPTTGTPSQETEEEETDTNDTEPKHTSDASDGEPVTIELTLPDTQLALHAEFPARAYVNQEVTFKAEGKGIGKTHLDSLSYRWNFGDLHTQDGKEVVHAYPYPGEYVVSLTAGFGRHSDTVRSTITVLPVSFALSWNDDGLLHLHNNARYEIDMSGYTLRAGRDLSFPNGTILLPNATLTIPKNRLHTALNATVTLSDPAGQTVASTQTRITPTPLASAVAVDPAPLVRSHVSSLPDAEVATGNFSFAGDVMNTELPEEVVLQPEVPRTIPSKDTDEPYKQWPYMALVGVLTLGCVGVLATRIR